MASRKKTAAPTTAGGPPKGMKQIVGGYAKSWNVDELGIIDGVVKEAPKTVTLTQGRQKTDRVCMEVHVGEERYTVWESATLTGLFSAISEHFAKKGAAPIRVWIRFDGYGTAKKGQNPPKLFTSAIG